MGVIIKDITSGEAEKQKLKEVKGVLITGMTEKGSADEAGLKENDIILRFNNVNVATSAELQEQIGKYRPGDKVSVTYLRNGRQNTVPVVLKNIAGNTGVVKPGEGSAVVFGARIEPLNQSERKSLNIDYGVKVTELNDGRFKDLGIRTGYIILSINSKKVRNAAEVREASGNESSLKSIEGVQSNGTYFSFQFKN